MLLKEQRLTTSPSISQPQNQTKMTSNNNNSNRNRDQAAMRIRSRYLHRLGVGSDSCNTSISSSVSSCDSFSVASTVDTTISGSPKRKHVRRRSRPDEIEFQPLKGCQEASKSRRRPENSKKMPIHRKNSKSTSVSFENFVVVHPIPNLDAYSEEMKRQIWTNSQEMESEVMRNYLEFVSEGMNWQDTLEEEDFFEYNNELVHPVHILNRHCSLQQNFLMGMVRARQACQ